MKTSGEPAPVVVRLRLVFSGKERLALANFYGDAQPASRTTCRRWAESCIDSTMPDVIQEYEQDCAARNVNQQKRSLGHAYLLWRWRYMHKSGTPGRKATKGRKVPTHD